MNIDALYRVILFIMQALISSSNSHLVKHVKGDSQLFPLRNKDSSGDSRAYFSGRTTDKQRSEGPFVPSCFVHFTRQNKKPSKIESVV